MRRIPLYICERRERPTSKRACNSLSEGETSRIDEASTIILSASVSVCKTMGLNGKSGSHVGPNETGTWTGTCTGVGGGGVVGIDGILTWGGSGSKTGSGIGSN